MSITKQSLYGRVRIMLRIFHTSANVQRLVACISFEDKYKIQIELTLMLHAKGTSTIALPTPWFQISS